LSGSINSACLPKNKIKGYCVCSFSRKEHFWQKCTSESTATFRHSRRCCKQLWTIWIWIVIFCSIKVCQKNNVYKRCSIDSTRKMCARSFVLKTFPLQQHTIWYQLSIWRLIQNELTWTWYRGLFLTGKFSWEYLCLYVCASWRGVFCEGRWFSFLCVCMQTTAARITRSDLRRWLSGWMRRRLLRCCFLLGNWWSQGLTASRWRLRAYEAQCLCWTVFSRICKFPIRTILYKTSCVTCHSEILLLLTYRNCTRILAPAALSSRRFFQVFCAWSWAVGDLFCRDGVLLSCDIHWCLLMRLAGLIFRPDNSPIVLLIFKSSRIVVTGARAYIDIVSGCRSIVDTLRLYFVYRSGEGIAPCVDAEDDRQNETNRHNEHDRQNEDDRQNETDSYTISDVFNWDGHSILLREYTKHTILGLLQLFY